jgi:hypothetical protein
MFNKRGTRCGFRRMMFGCACVALVLPACSDAAEDNSGASTGLQTAEVDSQAASAGESPSFPPGTTSGGSTEPVGSSSSNHPVSPVQVAASMSSETLGEAPSRGGSAGTVSAPGAGGHGNFASGGSDSAAGSPGQTTASGGSGEGGVAGKGFAVTDAGGAINPEPSGGTAGESSAEPEPGPSFERVYAEILVPEGCTGNYCHGGSAGEMTLGEVQAAFDVLVGQDAEKPVCGLTQRVVPGDPESSILWARVRPTEPDGAEPCAVKMPSNRAPLSAAQAQLVYDWILGGAQR